MGTSSLNVTLVQPSPPAPPTPPAPPPGPPPFVPWVYSAHTTCVFGTPLNGDELTPLLGPLGSFKTEDECRSACESQPNCTIYTYGNATQGIWGRHACYGRHDDVWDPHGEPDFYCGRRVAVSPPQPLPPTSALRAYAHLSAHSRCVVCPQHARACAPLFGCSTSRAFSRRHHVVDGVGGCCPSHDRIFSLIYACIPPQTQRSRCLHTIAIANCFSHACHP
jgi:hypothetical protein